MTAQARGDRRGLGFVDAMAGVSGKFRAGGAGEGPAAPGAPGALFAAGSVHPAGVVLEVNPRVAQKGVGRSVPQQPDCTVWLLRHAPPDTFLGNPRVHFQHYAGRMNAPRREQRAWRAWGCWALTRAARPEFPGDPRHRVDEPEPAAIAAGLRRHGHPGEAELWHGVYDALPILSAGERMT